MVMPAARRVLPLAMILVLLGCSYGADPDKRTDFVLRFAEGSTTLDPGAAAIVDRAARAARAAPSFDVIVAGFADDPRTPQSNQILSRIRAQQVANALRDAGIGHGRIQLRPRRAIGGDPGTESLRVEIRVAP